MKRYLLLVALALSFAFTGSVLADRGSDDGDKSGSTDTEQLDQNRDSDQLENDQEDSQEVENEQEDSQENIEEDQGPRPAEDRGGLFNFLKPARQDSNDERGKLLDSLKTQRDALQEQRKGEFGNLKESRAALEAKIKEQRDAFKAEIAKVKKEKPTVRKAFVEEHFTLAFTGLTTVSDRIQAKIDELSGKGYDMTDAKTALDAAKTSLAAAKTQFDALKAAVVSDTSDTTVTKPREIAKKIETLLKETRGHFHDAIAAMKTAVGIPDETATPEDNSQQ